MDPADPGDGRAVLDTALLERMRRENVDEPGLVDELLGLFLELTPPLVDALLAHLGRGETALAGRIAHRLAGSSRTLGALAFGDACARLEERAQVGDRAAIADDTAEIARGFAAVRSAIERYRAR